jgi:hypothetical protein
MYLLNIASLAWPVCLRIFQDGTLRSIPPNEENHSFRFEGIPNANLQENPCRGLKFRQIQLQQFQRFLLPVNRFEIFHGRLFREPSVAPLPYPPWTLLSAWPTSALFVYSGKSATRDWWFAIPNSCFELLLDGIDGENA